MVQVFVCERPLYAPTDAKMYEMKGASRDCWREEASRDILYATSATDRSWGHIREARQNYSGKQR